MEPNTIYIFCDGGCHVHSSKNGGYGIVLIYNSIQKHIWGFATQTTNNQMELIAAIVSLQKIKDRTKKVVVTTDSQYVVTGITDWSKKWVVNNWRTANKKPVQNVELWKSLLNEVSKFNDIEFHHCYGHGDNVFNNKVDELATYAINTLTAGEKLITNN